MKVVTSLKNSNWLLIISFISFLFCLYHQLDNRCNYNFFLLPLTMVIMSPCLGESRYLFLKAPGYTAFIIVAILRYCINPYMSSKTNTYLVFVNSYEYVEDGIYLMMYELICVSVYIKYRYSKLKYEKKHEVINFRMHKNVFVCLLLFFLIIGIIHHTYFFRGISLLSQFRIDEDFSNYELPTFVSLLWGTIVLWLYAYSIIWTAVSKTSRVYKLSISMILTLALIFLTFISQSSISRWYTIICGLSGYFLLIKCYPKYIKIINLIVIVPFLSLIIMATMIKNFSDENSINSDAIIAGSLDSYLAGPFSVNNGFSLLKTTQVGAPNFAVDVLNNMPIINHSIDRYKSTAYLYNKHIGRIFEEGSEQGDQIIPLISQSQAYFGLFFAPFLSLFFVWLFSFFDKKYIKSASYNAFLYAFVASWSAFAYILNFTISINWWWIRILPLMFLIYLINKFKKAIYLRGGKIENT